MFVAAYHVPFCFAFLPYPISLISTPPTPETHSYPTHPPTSKCTFLFDLPRHTNFIERLFLHINPASIPSLLIPLVSLPSHSPDLLAFTHVQLGLFPASSMYIIHVNSSTPPVWIIMSNNKTRSQIPPNSPVSCHWQWTLSIIHHAGQHLIFTCHGVLMNHSKMESARQLNMRCDGYQFGMSSCANFYVLIASCCIQ